MSASSLRLNSSDLGNHIVAIGDGRVARARATLARQIVASQTIDRLAETTEHALNLRAAAETTAQYNDADEALSLLRRARALIRRAGQ